MAPGGSRSGDAYGARLETLRRYHPGESSAKYPESSTAAQIPIMSERSTTISRAGWPSRRGDPSVSIADIRNVDLVMKDGVIYDPAALYAAVGVLPPSEGK